MPGHVSSLHCDLSVWPADGSTVPKNGCVTDVLAAAAAPETPVDACRIGVGAEVANRDLHDGSILPAVAACPDITQVMRRLRDASEENQLPAVKRCLAKGQDLQPAELLTLYVEPTEE